MQARVTQPQWEKACTSTISLLLIYVETSNLVSVYLGTRAIQILCK